MARKKFFPSAPSMKANKKNTEIEMVYKSAAESSLLSTVTANRRQYDRLSSSPEGTKAQKGPKSLKLGAASTGNAAGRACRNRVARLQCIFKVPSNLMNKMKEHYSTLKEQARSSNFKISDLFVGNALLLHVSATPLKGRRKSLNPSEGFVNRVRAQPVGLQREMRER